MAVSESYTVDGSSLRTSDVVRLTAADELSISLDAAALARVTAGHSAFVQATRDQAVYGTTTGVGANRTVLVDESSRGQLGASLLRSHAAGVGPTEADGTVRCALLIRLNQLMAGGSGVSPAVPAALAGALSQGAVPVVHRYGSIGTSDLSGLAEVALALTGEIPWREGGVPPVQFASSDALAFISSSAVTIATASLALARVRTCLRAMDAAAALTFLAVEGSAEALSARLFDEGSWDGVAASRIRRVVGEARVRGRAGARVQDPYALRTVPQVHGVALEAVDRLDVELTRLMNSALENPRVIGDGVVHHGGFMTVDLAARLDAVRAGVHSVAALSMARLGWLNEPAITALPPFLSDGAAGSSGVMILEYVAADLVEQLRVLATPVASGAVSLSRGTEEFASFASQSARLLGDSVEPLSWIVSCELLAAGRALTLAPDRLSGAGVPALAAQVILSGVVGPPGADRSLSPDLGGIHEVLQAIAASTSP